MTPTSRFQKMKGIWPVLAAAAFLLLASLACEVGGQSLGTASFYPPEGSTIYVGEEVRLGATIEDCAFCSQGHANLGASGAGSGCGSTSQLYTAADCTMTPTEAGELTVTVRWGPTQARQTDSITLTVVERPAEGAVGAQGDVGEQGVPGPQATCGNGVVESGEACEADVGGCGPNQTCNAATCQCESTGTVTATASASSDLNVRANPGPGCEVLPNVNTQTLTLDAKSSSEPVWYRIQGGGWVFSGALDDLNYQFAGDPATLPVDNDAVGCLFCGDGVCSPEINESAPSCEADCPAVCGDNFVTHDEACDPPESEPADPAYGESAVQWCNASCQFSSKEPPAEPPFDSSACYAACAEDSDCPAGFTCNPDSQCFIAQCAD